MPIIAVMNRKGGSGKSTLSTQLAAWFASSGSSVMLGDSDRQRSASRWLGRRGPADKVITYWPNEASIAYRSQLGSPNVVIDTPGGLQGLELAKQLARADGVVVPVGPSVFDTETTIDFLQEVYQHPRVASGRCRVAVVGMRWPIDVLLAWRSDAAPSPLPLLTVIAEASKYRECLESGKSIFDVPAALHTSDLLQWQPLLDWLQRLPLTHQMSKGRGTGLGCTSAVPTLTTRPPSPVTPFLQRALTGRNRQLRSPESFVETMPPDGINAEELQALRLQTRKQLALDMKQLGPAERIAGKASQSHVQQLQQSAATRTPTVSADRSESGWLTRLFRTR